jgi:succinoglycan biosynthesis transport protein ExoP
MLQYVDALRTRWKTAAGVVALCTLGALAYGLLVPTQYTSNLKLYVSAQPQADASEAYEGSLLSQQRVRSYTELATSPRVLQTAIDRLNLPLTTEQLSRQVSVTSTLDSVLIDVEVSASTPQDAQTIANALGETVAAVIGEIERPNLPNATAPIILRVVQPATLAQSPSSIGLAPTVAIGLLVGLAFGVGLAIALHLLDRSVRSESELESVLKKPNLGSIPQAKHVGDLSAIAFNTEVGAAQAEAFRQVRTKLDYYDVDFARRIFVVTSPKEEEGKTTTTLGLAAVMGQGGKRVLVIDADLRRPTVAASVGLEHTVGLTSVLTGRIPAQHALQRAKSLPFDVLASGPQPPNPSELLASTRMRELLRELAQVYETIVIDTPPLLPVTDAAAIAASADGVLMVCRFGGTKYEDVERAADILPFDRKILLGSVLTMVPTSGPNGFNQYSSSYAADRTRAQPATPTIDRPETSFGGEDETRPRPRPRSTSGSL